MRVSATGDHDQKRCEGGSDVDEAGRDAQVFGAVGLGGLIFLFTLFMLADVAASFADCTITPWIRSSRRIDEPSSANMVDVLDGAPPVRQAFSDT